MFMLGTLVWVCCFLFFATDSNILFDIPTLFLYHDEAAEVNNKGIQSSFTTCSDYQMLSCFRPFDYMEEGFMQNRFSFSFWHPNLLLWLNKSGANTTYWLHLTSVAALKDAVDALSMQVRRETVGPLYKLSIGRNGKAPVLFCSVLPRSSTSVGRTSTAVELLH